MTGHGAVTLHSCLRVRDERSSRFRRGGCTGRVFTGEDFRGGVTSNVHSQEDDTDSIDHNDEVPTDEKVHDSGFSVPVPT